VDFSDNEYTTAPGDNRNSGTDPAAPMASLRALLAAYDLQPGDTVWIDTGRYEMVATAEITAADAGIDLYGPADPLDEGHVATLDRNNSGFPVISLNAAAAVTVRDLELTGGSDGLSATNGSSFLTVDGVTVYNNATRGIYVADGASEHATIVNSTTYGTIGADTTDQNDGIHVLGRYATIGGNTAYHVGGSSGNGIYVDGATDTVIADNETYNNENGIYVRGGQFVVRGNESHDNTDGLEANDSDGAVYSEVYGNEFHHNKNGMRSYGYENIHDNLVHDNSDSVNANNGNGIWTDISYSRDIHDNEIYGNATGVYLQAGRVRHNRIYHNANIGVRMPYHGGTVADNTIYGNSTGIYVNLRDGKAVIESNLVYDNENFGIYVNSTSSYDKRADVLNNTVYQGVGAAMTVLNIDAIRVYNNILWINGGHGIDVGAAATGIYEGDYNDIHRGIEPDGLVGRWAGADKPTLADWKAASGQDAHSLSVDPGFIDIDGADNLFGWEGSPLDVDGGADDNFHISGIFYFPGSSPVIDAAFSDISPDFDRDGLPRHDDLGTVNTGAGVFHYYDIGCYEFQGSTSDTTPPTVLLVSPLPPEGEETTAEFTSIIVTFSEPMDFTSATSPANYELVASGGDGGFGDGGETVIDLTIDYTFNTQDVTLSWGGDLLQTDWYRLTLYSGATAFLVDLAGNKLDGDGDTAAGGDYVRTFRVLYDTTPPTLDSMVLNEAGAPPADIITLTAYFSEQVTVSPGALSLYNVTNDEPVPMGGVGFSYDSGARKATWDLSGVATPYACTYTATVAAAGVTDLASYHMAADYSEDFRTAVPGDANLDGAVDHLDYLTVKFYYGVGDRWEQADFDGNGIVDGTDVAAFEENFGFVLPPPPPAPPGALSEDAGGQTVEGVESVPAATPAAKPASADVLASTAPTRRDLAAAARTLGPKAPLAPAPRAAAPAARRLAVADVLFSALPNTPRRVRDPIAQPGVARYLAPAIPAKPVAAVLGEDVLDVLGHSIPLVVVL